MSLARALSKYARPRSARAHDACELCATPLGARHLHVVDLDRRALSCACPPCAMLFTKQAASNGKYRTVPDRVLTDPSFALDDAEWASLEIPVRLAFAFKNSRMGRWVAFYPSPAGPTESEVSTEAWDALAEQHALLREIEPDVEALLVYGPRGSGSLETFLAPIDVCYELVGLVRKHWKGFDGGDARPMIDAFFERLRTRSSVLRPAGGEQ